MTPKNKSQIEKKLTPFLHHTKKIVLGIFWNFFTSYFDIEKESVKFLRCILWKSIRNFSKSLKSQIKTKLIPYVNGKKNYEALNFLRIFGHVVCEIFENTYSILTKFFMMPSSVINLLKLFLWFSMFVLFYRRCFYVSHFFIIVHISLIF